MELLTAGIDYVRKLTREHSSIVLGDDVGYLIEAKLNGLAEIEGFGTVHELVDHLQSSPFNGLHQKTVEAMTTNETSFFRDVHPFEVLKTNILPELIENRRTKRELVVWCAAGSSGQEPYTIALILMNDFPQLETWNVKIIVTDLSNNMVKRTKEGLYSQLEVNRGLPASYLVKYFDKVDRKWQVKKSVRDRLDVRQMNLDCPWVDIPQVDILFMRNVLIYFDVETKRSLLFRARQIMKPDSWLFLGGSETTVNLDPNFSRVQFDRTTCYQRKE